MANYAYCVLNSDINAVAYYIPCHVANRIIDGQARRYKLMAFTHRQKFVYKSRRAKIVHAYKRSRIRWYVGRYHYPYYTVAISHVKGYFNHFMLAFPTSFRFKPKSGRLPP